MTTANLQAHQINHVPEVVRVYAGNPSSTTTSDSVVIRGNKVSKSDSLVVYSPFTNSFVEIALEQSWFWTKEWLSGELEVEQDIREGNYVEFDTIEDFIENL